MVDAMALLYRLAERQVGYFTTAQANAEGVSDQLLRHHLQAGRIERAARGIYRLAHFPAQRYEDLVVVTLWTGQGSAVSHETALVVHGIGAAMPSRIHVTVPRPFRGVRAGVVVHHAALDERDRAVREDVPVTTVERTLVDISGRSDISLVRAAARDALERGLTTRRRLDRALERAREHHPKVSDAADLAGLLAELRTHD
ncbi:MAG: type IV toxin-antitoxin system AbiEi family antitoxin domain-containing protein [Egibacteraceae bacterium]